MINPGYRPCLALLTALSIAGCSSSPMSRIDANRARYESWPYEIQEAVLYGRVVPGMTPEMVEMVLGQPSQVMNRSGRKGDEEVWIYKKSSGLGLKNSNISMGGGIGGVGLGSLGGLGGGMGGGVGRGTSAPEVEDEQDVVFQKGVVIRADPGLSKGK
ncbi:MAG: hypothetical protein EXS42_00830 [Lacunisphaera sp.]|nr:hypothetical protein [Lacunisphaera sp.]